MLKEKQSCSSSEPAFLPIPNFPPLLSSYNIPEPVIVPPGADAYPFLNPNPHCDEFLEKLSPLDADPCVVASRTETVARKTELTAAEHAGVPLSETTMMSTTSKSPANSVVGAPQIVTTTETSLIWVEYESAPQTMTDTNVTKLDSKQANLIICDVCNVTCNCEKVFTRHKEGRKRIKNTQNLNVLSISKQESSPVVDDTLDQESQKKNQVLVSSPINQETHSLVANDALDQEFEEKNQNLLHNEASVNSLFVCSIPEPGCDYQKIASEERHYIPPLVCRPSCKPSAVSTAIVQPSNVCTPERHVKVDSQQPLRDTTPVNSRMENLKPTDSETGDSEDLKTWCEICKIRCNPNDIIKHVSGNRHKKNLQKLKKIPSFPSNLSASVTTQCDLCGICCTSLVDLETHIKGKKHQKNLKKTDKHIGDSPVDVAKSWSQDPGYGKKVVLLDGSKRKDVGFLTSDEHAHPKRQKIILKEGCTVTCKACNVVCNGLEAFKNHLKGSKHSSVAMKESVVGSNK